MLCGKERESNIERQSVRESERERARREGERRRMGVRENMLSACAAFSESNSLSSAKM